MGIFLIAVIVLGYVVIWAIWHFFFRATGGDDGDGRARPDHHAKTHTGLE